MILKKLNSNLIYICYGKIKWKSKNKNCKKIKKLISIICFKFLLAKNLIKYVPISI